MYATSRRHLAPPPAVTRGDAGPACDPCACWPATHPDSRIAYWDIFWDPSLWGSQKVVTLLPPYRSMLIGTQQGLLHSCSSQSLWLRPSMCLDTRKRSREAGKDITHDNPQTLPATSCAPPLHRLCFLSILQLYRKQTHIIGRGAHTLAYLPVFWP